MTAQLPYHPMHEIDSVILEMRVKLDTLHSLSEGIVSSPQNFEVVSVADLACDYTDMITGHIDQLEDLISKFKEFQGGFHDIA